MHSHPFRYRAVTSTAEADSALASSAAAPLGGGTDLLTMIHEGLTAPGELVDLRRIVRSDTIEVHDQSLHVGGSARIADLARHAEVRTLWPAFADACAAVGTPALREMGTLGGNLCQRPRCWYFRRGISCLKNGGSDCPAASGENQYHAILEGGPCFIVHPSDPAVALVALDAHIEIRGAGQSRNVPAESFWVLPSERLDAETVLAHNEYVSGVSIPTASANGTQFYQKLMQRATWDFALVSIAAVRRADGDVRMVLGGVAPRPWRVPRSIEEDVSSGGIDEDSAAALASRAMLDAKPLARNGYKIRLAETLLRRAMVQLGA